MFLHKRLMVLVCNEGRLWVFTPENFVRGISEVSKWANNDLSIIHDYNQGVQFHTMKFYEDVFPIPYEYKVYSIPYLTKDSIAYDALIPKNVFNAVSSYLKGVKGRSRENEFKIHQNLEKAA